MSAFKFHVWPTEHRVITQPFGANPQNYAQFGLPGHEGLDIRAPSGSKIFCVAPGKIFRVHKRVTGHNYGIHVRVAHQDGYKTIYAHLEKALVDAGDHVEAGTVLGLADSTGNSFGAHLHLTLKREGARYRNYPSNIIDPTPFLAPLMGWQKPSGPYVGGWVMTTSIYRMGDLAQANPDGVTLRIGPDQRAIIPGGSIIIVTGDSRQGFTPAQVPKATLGMEESDILFAPTPPPLPTVMTIDGWAWQDYLHMIGNQAIINTRYGINLRQEPDRSSPNLGVVRTMSAVSILGEADNGYLPVRVKRADFVGSVRWPTRPLEKPIQSLSDLPDDVYLGWIRTMFLQLNGSYAIIRHRGAQLLNEPERLAEFVATVKGDAMVTIAGLNENNYAPVLVHEKQLFNASAELPEIALPTQAPDNLPPILPPGVSIQGTIPGWVLASEITVDGDHGTAEKPGLNLRDAPRRDANLVGFIPGGTTFLVMGDAFGEFTPVRVDEPALQPPVEDEAHDPDPSPLGKARIGLHASADPQISETEHNEFRDLRPGVIKLLSFHSAQDIARLASAHPNASWIIRAFLDFGGRRISPGQFFDDTVGDVKRALSQLPGKDVVIELHNEPNLAAEGLGKSWVNGADFSRWWLELLSQYRRALPGMRFLYPGLSPGVSITGVKRDHIQFIEASREAVDAADGLGVHLYWSNLYPMSRSLDVLDDYSNRFRGKSIWVTEASHNKAGATPAQKARQYLEFWHALQQRPYVRGVTYFVASASNPAFAEEIWVGRGIGKLMGMR